MKKYKKHTKHQNRKNKQRIKPIPIIEEIKPIETQPEIIKRPVILSIILWISLCLVYVMFLIHSQDSDIYQMIANGREILANGFLYKNPASIIGIAIINQQWLYCVLLALVDKFGYFGHIGFVFIQNVILVCLASYLINKKIQNKNAAGIIAMLVLVLSNGYMINIRPQIITMCLLLSHIIILDKAQKDKLWLSFIPIIIILEANLHGAVVLYHVFISIPYLISNKKINFAVLLSTLAIFPLMAVNPYGIDGALYTFKALFNDTFKYISIIELQPIKIFNFYCISFIITALGFIYLLYKKKVNKQLVFYTLVILALCIYQTRNLSLIMIPLIYIFIELYNEIRYIKFNSIIICMACILLDLVLLLGLVSTTNFDKREIESNTTPVKLVNLIEDKDANIFTEFNNGGYAQYMGCKHVFIDARPELYTDSGILKDYSILLNGFDPITNEYYSMNALHLIIKKYDFKYIMCCKTGMLNRVCETYKYQLIDQDDYACLYLVEENDINMP